MHKAKTGITPEGLPSIGLAALTSLVFALMGLKLLSFLFLGLTFFCCHFFRDPERVGPASDAVAVSPADGKVIKVERRPDPISGEDRNYIAIFMNVFNVHVNRSPVPGTVSAIQYHPGLFLNASLDKASKDNERCTYHITDTKGRTIGMVQIAGLVARRIVCRVQTGDTLARGERFGMIKFGSRVDLYLPDEYVPCVTPGQKVLAGQTIVAELQQ